MEIQNDISRGLQDFIFQSKYARYLPELKRRETWDEAVDRILQMHLEKYSSLSQIDKEKVCWAFNLVRQKRVLPSMRTFQFGGKAVFAHETRAYNCCVRHIDSIRAFAEVAYLMLCGCGTGIGLYKKFVDRLPNLVGPDDKTGTILPYTIEDTIEGWADSLEILLLCYTKNNPFSGRKIAFDYSKIRRKGTPLKTGGGKAPGYKPLKTAHTRIKNLLDYVIEDKEQTRLKSINIYDVLMHFADAVLSGGIRRTASITLFDPDDEDMLNAKIYFTIKKKRYVLDEETNEVHARVWVNGHFRDIVFALNDSFDKFEFENNFLKNNKITWRKVEPQRGRSNNSVRLLRDKCTLEQFKEIINRSRQFGEPGFLFTSHEDILANPCGEIMFVPVKDGVCGVQFCNLTTQNGALVKTKEDFLENVEAQTIIGTLQAGYTNFKYLSNVAKQLTEEEALLGNSITGTMDCPDILLNEAILEEGAKLAVLTNEEWAAKIGINPASRINCQKPEGTGSLAIGCFAPGNNAHHARRYFKRIQANLIENPYQFFKQFNPHMCEDSVWNTNTKDELITFPVEAPERAIIKKDLNAIQHLEYIKLIQQSWIIPSQQNNRKPIDHNVSCTVIVKDDEWDEVISYLFENRYLFAAVSFLSEMGDKDYPQAPYEEVTTKEDREKFEFLKKNYVPVDFSQMVENSDGTMHMAESSCAGGACLI
jgi:ribonucleoside-triphosphate reductase